MESPPTSTISTTSTGQKRPAPGDHKRRSSKACLSCRNRKVRCDVIMGGQPCTNCKLDGLECIVKEPNRGRRPGSTNAKTRAAQAAALMQSQKSMPMPATPVVPASTSTPPANSTNSICQQSTTSASPRPRSPSRPTGADDLIVTLTFDGESSADDMHVAGPHPYPRIRRRSSTGNASVKVAASTARSQPARSEQSAPSMHSTHSTPAAINTSSHLLPSYIRPLPSHIGPRDVAYLAEKGALTIVDDAFRDELLRIYVNHVYPFMPAVDLTSFIGAIVQPPDHPRAHPLVSLLLFQAVMFASVTFADARFLLQYGFRSPKEARKVFFARVRLLYGMDCETDQRAVLQAVLLMTYWYDSPDDGKDTWYWMGIALTLAQVEGLHRNVQIKTLSFGEVQLRRRIWWSCVMRDRLMALGIRRPTRIHDEEFDCPPLSLEDFGMAELPLTPSLTETVAGDETSADDVSDPLRILFGNDPVYNPDSRRSLAVMAIELSRLCVCIGHILRSQYTVVGDHPAGSAFLLKASVVPKRSEAGKTDKEIDEHPDDLCRCDRELQDWHQAQHDTSRYIGIAAGSLRPEHRVAYLHQALLQLIYLAASSVLHRPQAVRNNALSRQRVSDAAVRITKIAFDLQCSKQLRFMSTSSIPAFLSACLVHLMAIRSSDEDVRNMSIGRFYQCMHALQELQDVYASAVYALRFIITVLHNTDIRVPMLPMFHSNILRPDVNGVTGRTDSDVSPAAVPQTDTDIEMDVNQSSAMARMSSTFASFVDANGVADYGAMGQSILGSYSQAWAPNGAQMNGQLNGMHNQMMPPPEMTPDMITASPYIHNWADMDGLVPSMVNFDPDPNALMGGVMSFI
ncbi:hypothetical protein SEUCBS139899_002928 [Sporothrix eucalyptigena]